MNKLIIIIFLIINTNSCLGQDAYKVLIEEFYSKIPVEYYNDRNALKKQALQLKDFLPKGFSKKGDVDYTKELQAGLDKGGILLMPDFPILVNSKGIELHSNTQLIFQDKSKIIIKPNSETHYSAINIQEVENVQVYFANIEGDREKHLITKGEWGMGIRILGSKYVDLYVPSVNNSWGDGIYMGSTGDRNNEAISIFSPRINKARRNGISITSANGILIEGGVISNTNGTAPQSAIDIEPNRPVNVVNNIEIRNLTTYNNAGDGIMIDLAHLTLNNGKEKRSNVIESNIKILNHVDIGSFSGARINGRLENKERNKYSSVKIKGQIIFSNPTWVGNKVPIRFSPKPDRILEFGFYPNVIFQNISILDSGKRKVKGQEKTISNILQKAKEL